MTSSNSNGSPVRPSHKTGGGGGGGAEPRLHPLFSPNHRRLVPAGGADRKAGGGSGSGSVGSSSSGASLWIFVLCFMSILFAGLSSRQLPAMRIMTASPEDAYRHLYYYPPQPTTSSNSNVAGGGGSGSNKIDSPDGGSSVGLDNLEAVADDVINRDDDIDADDDDSVDTEGFFFDSEDERKDNFQNGLWDDDQSLAVAVAAAAEEKDAAILESQRGDEETDDGPWVAQLLSYPNSGTSYTQLNTRSLTNRTTATTTGHDDPERRQPLRPDMGYNAPYVVRPDLLPESGGFVLTKTHCEGHCFTCRPASESTELFELQCRTAAWTHNRTHHVDRYGMDIVKKFVHLIRDPLDNCVSRMHHGIKNAPPGNVRVHEVREAHTDNPVAGLDAWCSYLDEVSRPFIFASMSDRDDVSEVLKIPCHAEFTRYVKWHNAAYKMTQVKYAALPTYRLYYENYTSNYGGVVRELYQDFLQYPPISAHPRPFIPGKTYHYMFAPQHQLDIKWLVKSLALPPVWEMLQHYFSDLRTFNYTNDGRNRSIALLVSFPNSGTSYTINNVQQMNGASAGTNYGKEIKGKEIIPILPQLPNGPWVLLPEDNGTLPDVVLTKSHCTAYCDNCMKFVVSLDAFELGCHETFHHELQQHYNYTHAGVVDRAVHIFRSPFDNLVSRKHLGVKSRVSSDPSFAHMLDDSREALLSWCNYTDRIIIGNPEARGWSSLSPDIQALFESVPCSVEMFRHVQWHNLAMEMTKRKNIPVHYIYYEDYETHFNETVDGLMRFLELEVRNVSDPFEVGKSYESIFADEHSEAIAKFVRTVATPDCWRHLSHYFARWLHGTELKQPDRTSLGVAVNAVEPSVVWLLSFPNSGTTYTMANVEWMTYQSVASNYKKESDGIVPVREEYTLGPFYHNLSLSVPRHILTKTHCDGFCDDCSMQTSYMNLSGFEAGCGRSERIRVKGVITNPPYPSSVPKKVVHLIRSPWDNIVSRMHHGIFRRRTYLNWTEEQLAPFQNSREGVMSWCQYVDRGFWDARALNTSGLSVDDLQAITSVPCGPDFFRYVQWHNNAVVLMQKMGVPMHRIYYEDYTAQFNKTTQDLLDFLELRAVNPPVPFKTGKTYDSLMDIRDRRKAWDLIQKFATPELRQVLKRYESGVDIASEGTIEQESRRFLRRT